MFASLFSNRSRLFFIACVLAGGYFVYTFVHAKIYSHALEDEQRAAEQRLFDLEQRYARLQGTRQYVASDAYVEQEARRRLGLARPGEIPFVIDSPPPPARENLGAWWERLFPD